MRSTLLALGLLSSLCASCERAPFVAEARAANMVSVARPAAPASPSLLDAPTAARPVRYELHSDTLGVSRDGSWALVTLGYSFFEQPGQFRRVDLRTGAVEVLDPALRVNGLPTDGLLTEEQRARWRPPPTLPADLARVGALWSQLREAHHHRFAASASGVVFGAGDALYVAPASGSPFEPLSRSAANSPELSPDGTMVAWAEHVGRLPRGVGNYALHYATLPDPRTRVRVEGAEDLRSEDFRFSADGRWLYFLGWDPARAQLCLRRAPVGGPRSVAHSLLCGVTEPNDAHVAFSPSRSLALVAFRRDGTAPPPGEVELAWVRLADGALVHRHTRSAVFVLGGVMDDGLGIAAVGADAWLFDPARRVGVTVSALRLPMQLVGCPWRDGSQLVVSTRREVRLVQPRALFDQGPQAPW